MANTEPAQSAKVAVDDELITEASRRISDADADAAFAALSNL